MWSFGNDSRGELSTSLHCGGLGLPVMLAMLITGCGGAAPQKAAKDEKTAVKVERPVAMDHGEKIAPKKKKEGGIPLDAFFDNPLEVASNNAVVAGPASTGKEPVAAVEKPMETRRSQRTPVGPWRGARCCRWRICKAK